LTFINICVILNAQYETRNFKHDQDYYINIMVSFIARGYVLT
jgi:hypothetical protein